MKNQAQPVARTLAEVVEKLEAKKQKHLMNPETGSVDTEKNWRSEMPGWDEEITTQQEQYNSLVEVKKDRNGDWVEADKLKKDPSYTAR